jgi:hypothetical protein
MEDVHLWMIDQHLGRRSVSDFQRGVLALRKRAILAERRSQAIAATAFRDDAATSEANDAVPEPNPLKSRTDIAKAARLSSSQVVHIEKIQKQAAPELVAAVKAGTISLNAAAAVASLPAEEQKSAALGGKEELKQAAKRVRDVNRKTPPDTLPSGEADSADAAPTAGTAKPANQTATGSAQGNAAGATETADSLQASLFPAPLTFAGTLPCFHPEMKCSAQRITISLAPNGRWRARAAYLEQPAKSGTPLADQGCWRVIPHAVPRIILLNPAGNVRAELALSSSNVLRLISINGDTFNLTYTLTRQPDLDPISELDKTTAPTCP